MMQILKMDERDKTSSKFHSQQCLFPIASNKEDSQQHGILFPCISSPTSTKKEVDLDWLVNPSYQTEHEQDSKQCSIQSSNNKTDARELNDDDTPSSDEEHQKKGKKYKKRKRDDSDDGRKRQQNNKKEKKKKQRKEEKTKKNLHKEEPSKPDTIWIEETGFQPEEAYRLHRKPDIENLMYGSIYRLDVATYKIKSNLLCLGLKKSNSLMLSEKKRKKAKRKEMESRYWRDTTALFESSKSILPSKSTLPTFVGNVENFTYIPIDLPGNRDDIEKSDDQSNNTENTEDHLHNADKIFSQKTAELNKTLRENPTDIKTWIELANFQVKSVNRDDFPQAANTAAGNEKKKRHSKIVTEKQISVLEKALEHNPTSIELITYHLELCSNWWDDKKLLDRWRKVVFEHPNKTLLWRKYLLFLQSRVSMFTFRKTQKAYEKCFTMLSSIQEGTFVSHHAEAGIEEDLLDLFVQHCKFMKQSGHMEKSVASFQAMIELNCFCPEDLNANTPSAGQIAFLETFWDSGQPRFGEAGALGWKTWMDKTAKDKKPLGFDSLDLKKIFKSNYPSNDTEAKNTAEKEEELIKGSPKWKAWLKVEMSRDETQLKPWQPDQMKGETEDDCEDPERIVLFDDIKPSLFKLYNDQNKFKLVLCFLEILGVPLNPLSSSQSSDVCRYFELAIESLEQIFSNIECDNYGIGWQRYDHWYHCLDESCKTSKPSFERLQLVRNTFAQTVSVFKDDFKNYLITAWLQYECYLSQFERPGKSRKQRSKEVYKLAKAILKEPSNRNNFPVWQTFARISASSGDVSEARHVFDSTLLLGSQLEVDDTRKRMTLVPLYRSYIEMEIKQSLEKSNPLSHNRVIHLLVSLTENSKYEPLTESTVSKDVSSARILRAKKTYSRLCDDAIQGLTDPSLVDTNIKWPHVHIIVCSALFSYVTSGIQAAIDIHERILSSLSTTDDAFHHEHLWTSYLFLVKIHSQQENIPLKKIKQAIHGAIGLFPNNPFILEYFLQIELKSNITGEVRRVLDHLTHNAVTPVPWISAIHYETMRSRAILSAMDCNDYRVPTKDAHSATLITSLPTTGLSHRQRALFDRATTSVAGRQCVALWRMYMEFELKQGNKEQAKAVFYRALQNCAWAKILYLDAVKAFPDDIQNITDMMEEKELRVRTPMEEIDILMEEVQID